MRDRRIHRITVAVCALVLTVPTAPAGAAPSNDDFANAAVVSTVPFTEETNTSGSTMEPGEPDHPSCIRAQDFVAASIWYRFTPTELLQLDLNTIGSQNDTVLAVYTGDSVDALTEVACNDDRNGTDDLTSELFLTATVGTTYQIQVSGLAGGAGPTTFTLELQAPPPPPCPSCPQILNYAVPDGFRNAHAAGETGLGVNPRTNNAMLLMRTQTLRARWDDSKDPPEATWTDVSGPLTRRMTNDPILWTDPATGRTFVSQLVASCCSIIEFTDDDGATWTQTEPGIALPSWDHQTIGGGPYPAPIVNPVYPSQLMYCAQLGIAQCARSDDGGLTWGVPFVTDLPAGCGGLHGHIIGGPDGSFSLPFKGCGNAQAIAVSDTGGVTWERRAVPGTEPSRSDPKVAFDKGDRMYFVASSEGKPVVSTSDDGGRTWTGLVDVGVPFSIRNTQQPAVIAGDAGRAAVMFYGTSTGGDDQAADFKGEWHIYVSFTYDGGATWETVNATPGDPAQRGCIWMQGGGNPCRNLLDFQDMTVDAEGRVLVSYADGCTSVACIGPNGTPEDSRDSLGVIARQTTGKRLYAAFDPES